MSGHINLSLPFPPSVNTMFYTHGRTRHPSKRYREWQAECAVELTNAARITGPFEITMQFQRPTRAKRDLDNLAKAPLDAMTKAGVIEDDHMAQRIVLEWAHDIPAKGARVFIWITPVEVDA